MFFSDRTLIGANYSAFYLHQKRHFSFVRNMEQDERDSVLEAARRFRFASDSEKVADIQLAILNVFELSRRAPEYRARLASVFPVYDEVMNEIRKCCVRTSLGCTNIQLLICTTNRHIPQRLIQKKNQNRN